MFKPLVVLSSLFFFLSACVAFFSDQYLVSTTGFLMSAFVLSLWFMAPYEPRGEFDCKGCAYNLAGSIGDQTMVQCPECGRTNSFEVTQHHHAAKAIKGFSLIELLVVLGVMTIIVTSTLVILGNTFTESRLSAGVNTVSVACSKTKWLTSLPEPQFEPLAAPEGADIYYKNAAVFLDTKIALTEESGPDQLYTDEPGMSWIDMPSRVRIFGVNRNGEGFDNLVLIEPPFAVVFDERGNKRVSHMDNPDDPFDVVYEGTRMKSVTSIVVYVGDSNDKATILENGRILFVMPNGTVTRQGKW